MYRKYVSRCFSKKGFVLLLFSLALIFTLFGVGLHTMDAVDAESSSHVYFSYKDSVPVSIPVNYNSQRFSANTLAYGNIAFRGSKQDSSVWSTSLSSSLKQLSSVAPVRSALATFQIYSFSARTSEGDSFHLLC